ncbi:restriction endonuclease [uncultured Lamprocystis sp.]|uniref:restriction endonuclease n=1 Tax=uncultured Lamprocystis sp. TaxID=543132 RepID=UPI0025F18F86|nr:restriction endonuclease [uncultured Lamprocystis sp.]
MLKKSQAEFVQWMPFVLDALREFGGSATPREVYECVGRIASVPDEKRFAKLGSGSLRFPNQVAWARQYLVWEGLLSSPKHGIWMLTPAGSKTKLSHEDAERIFKKWVAIHTQRRLQGNGETKTCSEIGEETQSTVGYAEEVLSQLQALTPAAFERFCADLLKHLGLERVEVTGGRGDNGIDGEGYLPIGPLVTAKVSFQCKRYSGSVSPSEVQSFQGAIGDSEKGIFFTTGYFTDSAKNRARKPGCKPVELVDGEKLVEILEKYEFGLTPTKTYQVDYGLLGNYEKEKKKG